MAWEEDVAIGKCETDAGLSTMKVVYHDNSLEPALIQFE